MNQRGFAWIQAAVIVGVIAALIFAVDYGIALIKRQISEADKKGFDRGVQTTQSAYRERDNLQLQRLTVERDRLEREKAALEKDRDEKLAKKEATYASKLAQQQADFDGFITDINAGRVVWRDPGGGGPAAACGGERPATALAEGPGGGDGPIGGAGLSTTAERFLAGEANRANKVVTKLNLCRGVLDVIYGRSADL